MALFAPLLPLLLSTMAPPTVAMAVDCGSTPLSADGPVPWVESWMPPALQQQFNVLLPPGAHRTSRSTAPDSRQEQPPSQATTEQGEGPAFCPL